MASQANVQDSLLAHTNARENEASSALLSDSLDRLSLNSFPSAPPHLVPPSEVATGSCNSQSPTQRARMSPMSKNDNTKLSPSASRRSSSTFAKSSPSSPKLNRRTSSLSQNNDAPSKPSPRRSTSQNFAYNAIYQEEPVPPTSASVASDYFTKELELHARRDCYATDTVVIVHDSCYGHRFSRPKTSKIGLSLIVERPERVKAGMVGISSAYVRMGDRHSCGKYPPHPQREPEKALPFLIRKSARSARLDLPAVTTVHGTKWMQELTMMCNAAESKLASGGKELARPDTPGSSSTKPKLHEGDLYLCRDSLEAFQGALGGVLDGVDAIFTNSSSMIQPTPQHKRAFICVRPPGHHCSADMPSGFCWLNNVHVGIEYAAQTYGLTHAAIIDFDLHHGDGSQSITWDRNAKASRMPKNTPFWKKTAIGYFSLHDINSYPCEDGDREKVQNASLCIENAHGQSIWNVHLQPWKTEAEFWDLYQSRYLVLVDKARAFLRAQTERVRNSSSSSKPKGAIFISAGFDASEWEGAGMQRHKVNVPTEFYARFTSDILKLAEEDATSVDGRVISVLEGGYSDRALMSGILSHLTGLVGPKAASPDVSVSGANDEEQKRSGHLDEFEAQRHWWSLSSLSELEASLHPTAVPLPARKIRSTDLATYATPTQSFTAKVVDPSKVYRSLSGNAPSIEHPRPPTSPPPEVDWATAASELSKLLIPSDRPVDSCKPEELSESRVKREGHSSIGLATSEPLRAPVVETRGRKAKTPAYPEPTPTSNIILPMRPAPNNRRRTFSDLPSVADEEFDVVANNVDQNADRPTTSDSKAYSDGATAPIELLASTTAAKAETIKLGRTRRQSSIMAETQKVSDPPPPLPIIPKEHKRVSKNKTVKPGVPLPSRAEGSSNTSADVDNLTAAVKKITLRMPKDSQASKAPTSSAGAVAKAPRKQTEPKTQKPATAKSTTVRPAKVSKNAAPPTGQQSTPVTNEQPNLAADDTSIKSMVVEAPTTSPLIAMPESEAERRQAVTLNGETISSNLAPTAVTEISAAKPEFDFEGTKGTEANLATQEMRYAHDNITTAKLEKMSWGSMGVDPSKGVANQSLDNQFIPYNPWSERGENESSFFKPGSLTWLAPNANTPVQSPAAKQGKENLPVFTKDGYIPFAPVSKPASNDSTIETQTNSIQAESSVEEKMSHEGEHETNIWEVPITPDR